MLWTQLKFLTYIMGTIPHQHLCIQQNLQLTTEDFLSLFMEIRDRDSSSEDCIVRMLGCHGSRSLCSQVVELYRGDTWVQSTDDFQRDGGLQDKPNSRGQQKTQT